MEIESEVYENMAPWMEKQKDIPEGWIYLGDENERYVLGQPGIRNILVFGVNPSTASAGENNLDPTIRKVRKIAEEDDFDGWIMANLYPLRSTDPNILPKKEDPELIRNNLRVLKALTKAYQIDRVWAAWGNAIDLRFYLGITLYDIQEVLEGDFFWYYRGKLTKNGNPRHPLYTKSEEKFHSFPVADYAAAWKYADY